jgi:hypothetical protein
MEDTFLSRPSNSQRETAAPRTSDDRIVEQLLSNVEIEECIGKNRACRDKIKRAAEMLVGTLDARSALSMAANAIVKNNINVFVSYKKQDEDAARTVVDNLRTYSAGKLTIEYMADFPETIAGEEYSPEIEKSIKNAHWFILLLPDPSVDWDWCLFETGMFKGRMLEKVHKLFCLHHPDQEKLPSQIQEFQAVPAEKDTISAFLKKVFINSDPIPGMDPINPFIEKKIPDIADNIIFAIKPRSQRLERRELNKYVVLNARKLRNFDTDKELDEWEEELNGAQIIETDRDTLSIFGMIEKPATWGELVKSVVSDKDADKRWVREICASIKKVIKKQSYGPIQATFKGKNAGKLWRPSLNAFDRNNMQQMEAFQIIFLEEVAAGSTSHIPEDALALITVLRLTYRFRWEILKRYTPHLTVEEIPELKVSLDRIETEARSRGLLDKEKILSLFSSDPEDRNRIERMFYVWERMRNDERKGELDLAIKDNDVDKIKSILIEVSKINLEFLELAIQKMSPLMQSLD